MFEVVAVEPRRWRRTLVKVRCKQEVDVEKFCRTFEGYGRYSRQRYRLVVPVGATYTILAKSDKILCTGDSLSVDQMNVRGAFWKDWRLVEFE